MNASTLESGSFDALPHIGMSPPVAEVAAPIAPEQLEQMGVEPQVLSDLVLRLAYTVPSFSSKWAAEQTCLPMNIVEELCWKLKQDRLLEVLGQDGPLSYNYAATQRGRELATHLMEFCGYIGPAPVSLQAYSSMLKRQSVARPSISLNDVQEALETLVLPPEAVEVATLAAASGRSLFLLGPAGNGKTTLGRRLHNVFQGDLWIPHCINIGGSIIRLYDATVHQTVAKTALPGGEDTVSKVDRRWVCIRRPFVVAGGEMTIEELDLAYSRSLHYYEAPPHVKANGGTFLIDDFGRQRIEPHELLNRWIIPLESQIDHLTLVTGQKIQIPFELMLVVATNLDVSVVSDPAFLRRMGYRLHMNPPTVENYRTIFKDYAKAQGLVASDELLDHVLVRYKDEQRELRASEPRDLIERARDICRLHRKPFELNEEILNGAWRGYFGNAAG
jgi:predicted ATPase with chaperone activity